MSYLSGSKNSCHMREQPDYSEESEIEFFRYGARYSFNGEGVDFCLTPLLERFLNPSYRVTLRCEGIGVFKWLTVQKF